MATESAPQSETCRRCGKLFQAHARTTTTAPQGGKTDDGYQCDDGQPSYSEKAYQAN